MVQNPTATDRLLVVDAEVLVRAELAAYLRSCGYTVVEAAHTDEALTVLAAADLPIDAILCDAAAPGRLTAFQLAHWVRANRPGLDVILAGTLEKAADAAAELCEKGPHLARPYEPQAVSDFVRQRLARRARVHAAAAPGAADTPPVS